jgi:hypothetical protein
MTNGRLRRPNHALGRLLLSPEGSDLFETYPAPDGPAPPEGWEPERWTEPFEQNVLYRRWKRRVVDGDPNDFVIAISASPKDTGVSGTGKTTLALRLAKEYFDVSESGFDAETQATLNSAELGEMYRENGKGSALIFDEAQGVTASQGVNARRAMASSTIDAIGNVAANRMRAMTLIIVSQNIKWLDKNLLDMVDCWIRIRKEPADPDGPEATAYELYTSDMDFENRKTKTPAVTDLTWPDIPNSDSDYQEMERLKEEATSAATEEEPQELPVELRNKKIQQLYESGIRQKELAEAFELSQQRVSQIVG